LILTGGIPVDPLLLRASVKIATINRFLNGPVAGGAKAPPSHPSPYGADQVKSRQLFLPGKQSNTMLPIAQAISMATGSHQLSVHW
jgi:hypothetical protein